MSEAAGKARCRASGGHNAFAAEALAKEAAHNLNSRPGQARYGGPAVAYKCKFCPGWHVGVYRTLEQRQERYGRQWA